MKWTTGSK